MRVLVSAFGVRRLAFDLEAYPFIGRPDYSGTQPKTVREMLILSESYSPRSSRGRLYELIGANGTKQSREAGLNLNFYFAPSDYDHDDSLLKSTQSTMNSALHTTIFRFDEYDPDNPEHSVETQVARWVVNNMVLSKEDREDIKGHFSLE